MKANRALIRTFPKMFLRDQFRVGTSNECAVGNKKQRAGRSAHLRVRPKSRANRPTLLTMMGAVPGHPVIGIASLASSVIQQSIRDKWIGWDSDTAVAALAANPDRKTIRCL